MFTSLGDLISRYSSIPGKLITRDKYKDRIMRFYCLDSSCLFHFAWPRVSSGSDGLYIYLLCLTCRLRRLTVWSLIFLGGFILFSNYRVCVDFSGSSFIFFFRICVPFLGS